MNTHRQLLVRLKTKMQGNSIGEKLKLTRSIMLIAIFNLAAFPFGAVNAEVGAQHFVLLGPDTLKNCAKLQSSQVLESDEGFLVIEPRSIRGYEWECQLGETETWSWKKDVVHTARCAQEGEDFLSWLSFFKDTLGFQFFFSEVEPAKGGISYAEEFYSCVSHASSFVAKVVGIEEGDYSCEIEVAITDHDQEQLSANFELCSNIHVGKTYRFTQGPIAILDCDGQLPCSETRFIFGVMRTMPHQ